MTVFAYLRVSTLRQADEGLSIEVQESQIASYGKMHGLPIDEWVRDRGVSGSIPLAERTHGQWMLLQAKTGDVIICAKLDRLFRSARNALEVLDQLKGRGVSLHCIDLGGDVCNGIGQLVFTILSAVAEQERSRIRERISEAKSKMRSEGRYQGGKVPFGYRVNEGILVPDPVQQEYIKQIRKKHRENHSLRGISAFLREEFNVSISHNAIRHIVKGARKFESSTEMAS